MTVHLGFLVAQTILLYSILDNGKYLIELIR